MREEIIAIPRRGEKYFKSVLLGANSKFDAIELGKLLQQDGNYLKIILDGISKVYEDERTWELVRAGYNKTYYSFEEFNNKSHDDFLQATSEMPPECSIDWSFIDIHLWRNTFIVSIHVTDNGYDSWWEINHSKNIFDISVNVDEEDIKSVVSIIENWELNRMSNKKDQVKQARETQKYLVEKSKRQILQLFESDCEQHTIYSIYNCIDFSNEFDIPDNNLYDNEYELNFYKSFGLSPEFYQDANEQFREVRNFCILETCLTALVNECKL